MQPTPIAEEEARQLWCPHSGNRMEGGNNLCLAGNCAAWVSDYRVDHNQKITVGYCGFLANTTNPGYPRC